MNMILVTVESRPRSPFNLSSSFENEIFLYFYERVTWLAFRSRNFQGKHCPGVQSDNRMPEMLVIPLCWCLSVASPVFLSCIDRTMGHLLLASYLLLLLVATKSDFLGCLLLCCIPLH